MTMPAHFFLFRHARLAVVAIAAAAFALFALTASAFAASGVAPNTISTFAGTGDGGWAGDGGPATDAVFRNPAGISFMADGSMLVADGGNNVVRKIATDGTVSTVAGVAQNCYVQAYGGDGGPATSAYMCAPGDAVAAPDGTIYIADSQNHRIRKVAPNGTITTVAGNGDWINRPLHFGNTGDGGQAVNATLHFPRALELGPDGTLYLASGQRVRKIAPNGVITTVAGSDGYGVSDIVRLSDGSLLLADSSNRRIRKIDPSGVITTVAGNGEYGNGGDGGQAVDAQLAGATGLAVGSDGTIFVAHADTARVRKIAPNGVITTIAGTGAEGSSGDGGQAVRAEIDRPSGLALDADGTLYIADTDRHRIRAVTAGDPIALNMKVTSGPGVAVGHFNELVRTRSATFNFETLYSGGTLYCSLDGAESVCDSRTAHTYTGVADGAHTFAVRHEDEWGNSGPTLPYVASCFGGCAVEWTVDATAPAPPTIVEHPLSETFSRSAVFAALGSESNDRFQCSLNGSAFAPCTNSSMSYAVAPGHHAFRVRELDVAGNESAPTQWSWTVFEDAGSNPGTEDPTPPVGPTDPVGPPTNPPTNPTPPGKSPAAPPTRDPNAVDLLLGCTSRQLVLNDLYMRNGRVQVRGVAREALRGRRVTLRFGGPTGKPVGSATVGNDGRFAAEAKLPPKKIRGTNKARYTVTVGRSSSSTLKLTRRMNITSADARLDEVLVRGKVATPLAKPARRITLLARSADCKRWVTLGSARPSKNGRFAVRVKKPAGAAVVVRASTTVRTSTRSKRTARTYTLPYAFDFAPAR